MTIEHKHLRDDGFEHKFGESGEELPGDVRRGETWTELKKEEDDYWEYKSEKYTLYPKKLIGSLINAVDDGAPRMIRSGLKDFKNNRNYYYAE